MSKNEFTCDCTVVHEDVVREVSRHMLDDELYGNAARFFKILGDTTRVKIIAAIDKHEMCVCDIANILSMTKSAVSHQLATLREAGFVKCRRDGKTAYYSLTDAHIQEILESGIDHNCRHVGCSIRGCRCVSYCDFKRTARNESQKILKKHEQF